MTFTYLKKKSSFQANPSFDQTLRCSARVRVRKKKSMFELDSSSIKKETNQAQTPCCLARLGSFTALHISVEWQPNSRGNKKTKWAFTVTNSKSPSAENKNPAQTNKFPRAIETFDRAQIPLPNSVSDALRLDGLGSERSS